MLAWIREWRRNKIAAQDFRPEWIPILSSNASYFWALSASEQAKTRRTIQVLVAEKNWEGCCGLALGDEHRVTIAAQIARITLHFEHEYFDNVKSVLVYPDAYLAKSTNQIGTGVVVEDDSERLGEAWYRGPVILSWADVLSSACAINTTRNVVIHEFAHQLDMQNGSFADGFPTIESPSVAEQWSEVMPRAFEQLRRMCSRRIYGVLDCYAATSQAEFFAVASESYFEQPAMLQDQWPEVYRLLDDYYRRVAD